MLVVTSGDRRVDEKKVDALVGKTGRADAEFVKARTGFSIGGVSPVGARAAAGDADRPRAVPLRRDLGRGRPSAWRVQAAAAGPGAADRRAGGRRGAGSRPPHERSTPSVDRAAARAACCAAPAGAPVPSPCISVCRMDADTRLVRRLLAHARRDRGLGPHGRRRQARGVAAARRRAHRDLGDGQERSAMKHITFYLDFISPYAYLAFEQLPEALEGLSYSGRLPAGAVRRPAQAPWPARAGRDPPASASGPTARCCGWRTRTASRCRCRPRIRSTRCALLRLALACGATARQPPCVRDAVPPCLARRRRCGGCERACRRCSHARARSAIRRPTRSRRH